MFTPGAILDGMTLGGISVMSGPSIVVDGDGTFASSFVIPQLDSGAQDLIVYSNNDSGRWSAVVYVLAGTAGDVPASN